MEKQHPYMSPLHAFVQLYFSSLLRSLRHKLWWKYILFQFHCYVHCINNTATFTALITFSFSFHYYVHYALIKRKNMIFLMNNINFATTFTAPGSWKIISLLLLLLRSLQRDPDKKMYYFGFHHFYFSATSTSSTTSTMLLSR